MKAINGAGARNAHRANALRLAKQNFLRILYHNFPKLASRFTGVFFFQNRFHRLILTFFKGFSEHKVSYKNNQ